MSPISCCVAIKRLELQPFIEFNFGLTAAGSEIIKRQIHDAYGCNIILCVRAPCILVLFEVMLSRPLRQIVILKALSSNLG
jgi:ABC-type antimicrobial peptide transport system permease subunit